MGRKVNKIMGVGEDGKQISYQSKEYYKKRENMRNAAAKPRRCVVCGSVYKKRRKNQQCCNRRCRAYMTGFAGYMPTKEQCEKGQKKRALHPLTGPYETNCVAKYWALKSPIGKTYQFRNLQYFVREHKDLFGPDGEVGYLGRKYFTRAGCQLKRLRPEGAAPIPSWKGWTWYYVLDGSVEKGTI